MLILLVEDDPVIGRSLSVSLELEVYQVKWAKDLRSARELFAQFKVNLILLDIGLPDGSGFDFLAEVREAQSQLPVLILTAQTDEDSVVRGLELGADDYVRKPFGQRELMARIQANLRAPQMRQAQIQYGSITVKIETRQVLAGDREVAVNRREFDVLHFLVMNNERVVSREAIIRHLNQDAEMFDRTIDSHISHLRAKLKDAGEVSMQITSVYGVGYRLEKK